MSTANAATEERYLTRTGRWVEFRPARPDDLPLLRALFEGLSDESRRLRFLAATRHVNQAVLCGMLTGGTGCMCLLGFDVAAPHLLAVAQYVPDGRGSAEVAFAVEDKAHGEGIATEMLRLLIDRAAAEGLTQLTALVLADNKDMLNVFSESGWPTSMKCSAGLYRVVIDLRVS